MTKPSNLLQINKKKFIYKKKEDYMKRIFPK